FIYFTKFFPFQMSLTIQQIILDAKRLASRLKEHDSSADVLLSQTQSVYKQIDAMRQYQEEVSELNDAEWDHFGLREYTCALGPVIFLVCVLLGLPMSRGQHENAGLWQDGRGPYGSHSKNLVFDCNT
ncbi:unnamed protein product, partial [Timema podura]|nr:unnamed protein product [Timema podura]